MFDYNTNTSCPMSDTFCLNTFCLGAILFVLQSLSFSPAMMESFNHSQDIHGLCVHLCMLTQMTKLGEIKVIIFGYLLCKRCILICSTFSEVI